MGGGLSVCAVDNERYHFGFVMGTSFLLLCTKLPIVRCIHEGCARTHRRARSAPCVRRSLSPTALRNIKTAKTNMLSPLKLANDEKSCDSPTVARGPPSCNYKAHMISQPCRSAKCNPKALASPGFAPAYVLRSAPGTCVHSS